MGFDREHDAERLMRVSIPHGSYNARGLIAAAQRVVNMYFEKNPEDSLAPYTAYNAPGLTPLVAPSTAGPARGLYWANTDTLYYVVGNTVYNVVYAASSNTWSLTTLGTITTATGIVSMIDNGSSLVLVDGSANGYEINLTTNAFSQISEANNSPPSPEVYAFYGATRVDILDGFITLNQPGTQNLYSTYNNEVVFDSLWFAAKNGYSDNLITQIVTRREIWLLGERTTEIWFDSGSTPLPFQIMPGPFIQHGCIAPYSVAQVDGAIFWLAQDQTGRTQVLRGEGYQAEEISTLAMENEFATYSAVSDAVGFCFTMNGHAFYQLNFPTANKTWRFDERAPRLWHEAVWLDANGNENMHRASCAAWAYGFNVCGDWQTGQLYAFDLNNVTDAGNPMCWEMHFPHMMKDGQRVTYPGFTLDVQAATAPLATTKPIVNLQWSDDRGKTYSNPIPQTLGLTGQYLTQPKWNRLGMARDRVFKASGTVWGKLAVNGAFLEPEPIVWKS
jgi:hypothetical protein